MAYYIDWSNKKKLEVVDDKSKEAETMSWEDFIEKAKGDKVFLETGCPSKQIYNLLNNKIEVNLVKGRAVKGVRGEGMKTDKADVVYLREGVQNKVIPYKNITEDFYKTLPYRPIQKLYALFTDTGKIAKQISNAFEKEYPIELIKESSIEIKAQIKGLEKLKKGIADQMTKDFKPAVKKLGIKGIGEVLLAQILTLAPPQLFPHHIPYLKYCGFRANSGTEYNRNVKTLYYLCVGGIIKHRTPKWRELYDKIKKEHLESKEFQAKYESLKAEKEKKYKIQFITFKSYTEKVVMNRISTLLCKKVYETFAE